MVHLTAAGSWADEPLRELARNGVRWPLVVELAAREGVAPAVWDRLVRVGALPETPIDPDPTALAGVQAFRMSVLEDRLDTLLRALADQGLPVVLLKGAAIATRHLGSFRERPMGDLDLLLRPGDAEAAHGLARSMGWSEPVGAATAEVYRAGHHHLPPLDTADGLGFGLEIHTALFPAWSPFRLSVDEVWAAA